MSQSLFKVINPRKTEMGNTLNQYADRYKIHSIIPDENEAYIYILLERKTDDTI